MWWLGLALASAVAASIHDNTIGAPDGPGPVPEDPFTAYNSLSPIPYTGGTYHFVSSTFPEVDSRGFHGGMFDGIGDYYPSWPSVYYKRFHKRSVEEPSVQGDSRGERKKRSVEQKSSDNDKELQDKADDHTTVKRRTGGRIVRGMEMGSSGFHGDVFNSGFGDFSTMKRSRYEPYTRSLRGLPAPMNLNEEAIRQSLRQLTHAAKRRPEMDAMGFHGDTFGGGFGDFETMKKRRPEMDAMGFHGDTFGGGFGDFETMKKRRPEMDAMGFHGDTFGGGFGDFETMKKRRPEMDAMGFHGDTFGGGFGDFETMKKRRPEMDAMGFHGDTFGGGFGDFETMKKRRPEMDAMGFHGDTFGGGFGDFETMKKRRPEMDAMGFHGDTFGGGFGDFETMKKRLASPHVNATLHRIHDLVALNPIFEKPRSSGHEPVSYFAERTQLSKRRPEMDAMGFHGGVFSHGFGDFETMKRQAKPLRGF